jgi:hypothetical protein
MHFLDDDEDLRDQLKVMEEQQPKAKEPLDPETQH